jgi:DNA segregation ATPase FtsK/SpoIIIE, S-DNA-T family
MKYERKVQLFGILLIAFGLMYGLSLIGHSPADDMRITSDDAAYRNPFTLRYDNPGGLMGAFLAYIIFLFLGWPAFFLLPLFLVLGVWLIGFQIGRRLLKHAVMLWLVSFEVFLMAAVSGAGEAPSANPVVPEAAGLVGRGIVGIMFRLIGAPGAYIFLLTAIACTLFFYATISHRFRNFLTAVWTVALGLMKRGQSQTGRRGRRGRGDPALEADYAEEGDRNDNDAEEDPDGKGRKGRKASGGIPEDRIVLSQAALRADSGSAADRKKSALVLKDGNHADPKAAADGGVLVMPGPELLNDPEDTAPVFDERELADTARTLRETLETFGVNLSGNIEMFPGPIITRFEIKPAAGVKVNQIANLSEDLALNLRAKSIRIVAPIPGKAAIGIEIPNRQPQMVNLKELILSDDFGHSRHHLPIILGKDIAGKPYVADLAAMPHLLIAGTTGSGKSVCINVIITSLIYSLRPENLHFIFVDPKMLELSVYKDIPYLREKVVTNAKQAERVLSDAVIEMEDRYRTLASASVRSIVDYNAKQKKQPDKLPYIVIVIDELADLMMSASSSRVELLITRLAQMARAVGIHLILATQRPSVDVITGLIKANFPSRIAFQVATKIDSRTILDGNGAEKLLGKGDMLFLEAGLPEPLRLHGAYISSEETERIVTFIKDQPYSQVKQEEVQAASDERAQMRQFSDPVLLEAIETVIRQGQASVSLLQRKLGVGYQRAARLIDELEEMKVIGEYNESKARDVLVDKTFLDSIKSGKTSKP